MNRLLALPLCLLLTLGLTSCLEFDGQEVYFQHDEAADRIDVLLIYRGLYAESRSDEDKLKKAVQDLDSALQTGEFCFWNNWPLQVDLTRDIKAPKKALAEHVAVENGGLFTDPTGVLCAWQFVRVTEAKAFLQKVNTLLELAVQASLVTGIQLRGKNKKPSRDTREFVREFLREDEPLLVLEGNRLALTIPFAQEDVQWLMGLLEDHFLVNVSAEQVRIEQGFAKAGRKFETDNELRRASLEQSPSYRFFWDNPVSLDRRFDHTTVALGTTDAEFLQLNKAKEGQYDTELLEHLRKDGRTIEEGVPDAELLRRFTEFRERDVKLPPKLASKRSQ